MDAHPDHAAYGGFSEQWSFVQVLADRLRDTTRNLSEARLEVAAVDVVGLTDEVISEE